MLHFIAEERVAIMWAGLKYFGEMAKLSDMFGRCCFNFLPILTNEYESLYLYSQTCFRSLRGTRDHDLSTNLPRVAPLHLRFCLRRHTVFINLPLWAISA